MNELMNQFEIDAQNPLLRDLKERSPAQWLRDLAHDPRETWPRPYGRVAESYTKQIEHLVVPTAGLVSRATSVSTMMISSLRDRDPRNQENLKRVYEMATYENADLGKDLQKLPWFREFAQGAVLRGPTGCAKTHEISAILRNIPQLSLHGENLGWTALTQVNHLRVYMPTDSSRSGLYMGIVSELDHVLSTHYAEELARRKTVEKQLLYVLRLLMIHRVGLLVLEEAQERTLGTDQWSKEFCTVFLRMMNCGIPLVLVGNPRAFDNVLSFSQALRRLTKNGLHEFMPYFDARADDWCKKLVPGIWGWTVFDREDSFKPSPELLYKRTGGIPDVLATYRRECLVVALRVGGSCVDRSHFEAAWCSPAMVPLHRMIDGYVDKDSSVLQSLPDQPVAYLEERWSEERAFRRAMKAALGEGAVGE